MLISQTVPNLIGGVTQQPPAFAQPNQGSVVDNCLLSPIDGLTKRPPTQHVAKFAPVTPIAIGSAVHFINRDGTEKYAVVVNPIDGAVQVWDMTVTTGGQKVVLYGDASDQPYLSTLTPDADIRMLTIADTTYIVNRKQAAALAGTTFAQSVAPTNIAVFQVKAAQNSAVYTVNVDGVTAATYTAAASGVVKVDDVAAGLVTALNTAGYTSGAGWTKGSNGGYFYLTKTNGAAFRVECLDSISGSAIVFTQNSVRTFTDLPAYAYQGMVVKVSGDSAAASYYVQFAQSTYTGGGPNQFPGPGVWQECPSPGVTTTLDALTMPRQMRRLQDDASGTATGVPFAIYFKIDRPTWATRTAGDATNNPTPSFVGRTINDVFLFRNRLGFLADTSVVLSESGNFLNFWRRTTLETLPSDPIDVSAAHPRVVKLRSAVQWNQELVIFGDLVQFILGTDGDVLSASTVKITAATEFDSDPDCRPVAVGNVLYFPYRNSGFGGVREYYVEQYTNRKLGRSITDHVPKYIAGNITSIAHCPSADLMLCRASGDPGSVYVYKWVNASDGSGGKLQSAWSRWNFDQPGVQTRILGVQFWGSTAYLVIRRNLEGSGTGYTNLESILIDSAQLNPDALGPGSAFVDRFTARLDRQITVAHMGSVSYDSVANVTVWDVVYPITAPDRMTILTRFKGEDGDTSVAGRIIPVLFAGAEQNFVSARGDWTAYDVWIGENYTMTYRFGPISLRDQQGSVSGGRLQLRTMSVRYTDTRFFQITVTADGRDPFTQNCGGLMLGESFPSIGDPKVYAGKARVLIGAKSDRVTIELVNDTPLPCKFSDAEWEGFYYARANRR
jgi:hypothetical protein